MAGGIPFLFFLASFFWLSLVHPLTALAQNRIDQKIIEAQEFYQEKIRSLERELSSQYQLDYAELRRTYGPLIQELHQKAAMISQITDPAERLKQMMLLHQQAEDSQLEQALELSYQFENAMEKDHAFIGAYLDKLEAVLDEVISEDPLFEHMLRSKEFRDQKGLILVRVVWRSTLGSDISGETGPLHVFSPFSNKAKAPLLIKLTPLAFASQAFLKSILIHELNHAYAYRQPQFSMQSTFQGPPVKEGGALMHYFSKIKAGNPSYQFYLVHEFYSFKTQVLYDEKLATPSERLDPANRQYFDRLMTWTFQQMNVRNQSYVTQFPQPPLWSMMEKYYGLLGQGRTS